MASTYIKNFQLPPVEGSGFVKMMIEGDEGVHQMDVDRMKAHILQDPVENLPKPNQVHPEHIQLASGKMHVKRTAKNVVTVSKPH